MTSLMLFFTVLITVFIAEMGDKTQLMLIAMTSKYKIRSIIIGTLIAILVLNGLAVALGGLLNEILNKYLWVVRLIACLAFFYFSVTSLMKDDDEEEEEGNSRFSFAPLAVFCTFFIAELGDKTQLASITFGATNGLNFDAILIWVAASIGLFAADMIGLLIGILLQGKTPESFFNLLAFAIFAVFGFVNLPEALYLVLNPQVSENVANGIEVGFIDKITLTPYAPLIMILAFVVFVAICAVVIIKRRKN